MKFDISKEGLVAVVRPHDALTAETVDDFSRVVRETAAAKAGRVVVDCVDVAYLDSRGIETLMQMCGGTVGCGPRLAALTDTCREALDLTDVLSQLDVFDTVENAIRSYRQ